MSENRRYLFYSPEKKYEEGLLDRRSCLCILLAEAKLSGRIAVIHKFKLGSHHNNGMPIESYLIGEYFNIDRIDVQYIFENDFKDILKQTSESKKLNVTNERFDFDTDHSLVIRHLRDDNYWNLKLYDVFALAKNYHGVGVKIILPEITPTEKLNELQVKFSII